MAFSRWLILGLGNPGSEYRATRHNVGFMVLDTLASRRGIVFKRPFLRRFETALVGRSTAELILVKPLTYMNRSGAILPPLVSRYEVDTDHILIVVDNMDLPTGSVRVKRKGSPSFHNGISSIETALGTGAFPRLYIGVGRPVSDNSVVEHVLSAFEEEEGESLHSALDRAANLLDTLLKTDFETFLNTANSS